MKLKSALMENWRWRAGGAGLIALLGLMALALPFTQWVSHFSYDLPFLLQPTVRPAEALIVLMDDPSHEALHQPVGQPWDRTLHARLIEALAGRHVKAVVFDVLFDQDAPQPKADEQFASAIHACGCVVLGAKLDEEYRQGLPVRRLRRAGGRLRDAAPWGIANLPKDSDGVIRRQSCDEEFPSLAWQAAALAGVSPPDRLKQRWLHYYGPGATLPHVSYSKVLEPGAVPDNLISNRVVFVGAAPVTVIYEGFRSDEYPTPYHLMNGENSSGVEIHATAFLNLWRRDWLTQMPWWVELALVLTLAPLFMFLLPAFGPRNGWALGIGGSVGVAAAAMILQLYGHIWFCWAAVSLVQIPIALLLPRSAVKLDDESLLASMPEAMDHAGVFISYASEDRAAACSLARALLEGNVAVWLDKQRLQAGQDYERKIEVAIKHKCSFFISVISKATEASPPDRFVHKERRWAADRHVDGCEFYLPIVIDNVGSVMAEPQCFSKIHREYFSGGRPTRSFCKRLNRMCRR
jgi:CHASE2 domain-containing sensor protein